MASNPKDPMSKFFEQDIAGGKRSNFNWSYKNRVSADFNYLIPVGLWDVPSDHHFELDVFAALSSNPTIGPILGKVKFRLEAYFVEKAAYVDTLRNNDRVPLDRNVPFPHFKIPNGGNYFSPRGGLLELLQMLPAGFTSAIFDGVPYLNAIPLLMYYDIYRNYYVNPQDPWFPYRSQSYVPYGGEADGHIPIVDNLYNRDQLDDFILRSRKERDVFRLLEDYLELPVVPYDAIEGTNIKMPSEIDHLRYNHRGLLRRTLNNDFFTSFVSNANVELMKSHANVSVDTIQGRQVVNVEQISLANRNWRIATRSLLWGTDWKDYNKVHYGVNLIIPYGKPQFLGALSSDVTFNDVISQAQTGDQNSPVDSNVNLGSRAGIAYGALKSSNKKFVEFNTKDEGYVMVLASLTPEVDYYQGIDPMYYKTNLQHSWMLELNSVGMQDFHSAWMSAIPVEHGLHSDSTSSSLPARIRWDMFDAAEHKVPIWYEYMAKYNQLHGLFTGENQLRYWVFSRPFTALQHLFGDLFGDPDEPPTLVTAPYTSTYGLPEMFNYPFANIAGTDNFQLQFNWDCKVSSMLDKQVIAYL